VFRTARVVLARESAKRIGAVHAAVG